MFVICPFFIALFIYVEGKVAKEPIIPLSLFENRTVTALLLIMLFLGAVFLSGVYYMSLFFQVVYGVSAMNAGLKILPAMLGVSIMAILSGLWVSKFGTYKFFFFAGPVVTIAGIALISGLNGDSSELEQAIYLAIYGVGIGFTINIRMIALQASVPRELIAIATAVGQTCNSLGSAVGLAITGSIFNNMAVQNMADDAALQFFVGQFQSRGFPASTTDTLALLEMLQDAQAFYPHNNTSDAALYNATLETATSELTMGFSGAFSTAYLCLLPYPILILLLAFLVKETKLGKPETAKKTEV
ncbi:hypothetical protein HDU98_004763 [Podochytrium sp. JEL0797]|nr:hypothetical protein HDU98_004763 [Podochytrium sp. JEL0797]